MLPKPPSRTTAPSRMSAMACAIDCTILLIIGANCLTARPRESGDPQSFIATPQYRWIPACAGKREQVSPHYACARFFGEGRHDLAGETAQAVVCRAGAAIEQHVTDAELSQVFHLASDFVGRAVERALLACFTRIGECH